MLQKRVPVYHRQQSLDTPEEGQEGSTRATMGQRHCYSTLIRKRSWLPAFKNHICCIALSRCKFAIKHEHYLVASFMAS